MLKQVNDKLDVIFADERVPGQIVTLRGLHWTAVDRLTGRRADEEQWMLKEGTVPAEWLNDGYKKRPHPGILGLGVACLRPITSIRPDGSGLISVSSRVILNRFGGPVGSWSYSREMANQLTDVHGEEMLTTLPQDASHLGWMCYALSHVPEFNPDTKDATITTLTPQPVVSPLPHSNPQEGVA